MVHLGQRLYNERKRRGISLDEAEKATKIRSSFLSSIEKGEYNRLPSPAYAKGFVMNYASYLGFPARETLALFRREFDEKKMYRVLPEGMTHAERYAHPTFRVRRTTIAVVGILLFLVGYLFFQYRSVFFNPPLSVSYPPDNSQVAQMVTVKGTTDPNAVVAINGDIVSVNDDGTFSKSIQMAPGKTQIDISAKSRYGKTTTTHRTVTVR